MKYCKECKVKVQDPRENCPLCHTSLDAGDGTEQYSFPDIPTVYHQHPILTWILIALSVICVLVSFIINIFYHKSGWWSVIVVSAIIYFWILLLNLIHRRNQLASMWRSVLPVCIILLLVDIVYGWHRWSVNYAIPFVLLVCICCILVVSIMRSLYFRDFLVYFILVGAFSIIPLVLMLTNITTVYLPSIVCSVTGLGTFLLGWLFADAEMKDEFKRRFHL